MRLVTYKFDFVRRRKIYYLISVIILTIGIVSLFVQQLNLGIDFQSGSRLDIDMGKKIDLAKGKEVLRKLGYENPNARIGGKQQEILIFRTDQVIQSDQIETIKKEFQQTFQTEVHIQEQVVDPIIGRELAKNAILSVAIASIGMVIYLTFRFEYRFAVAAILALLHDAIFTIGMFSILQIEVDAVFIAALLTIIGYSINDTIVIFDRIRENLDNHSRKLTWNALVEIVNRSIHQTLVRSHQYSVNGSLCSTGLICVWRRKYPKFRFSTFIRITFRCIFFHFYCQSDLDRLEMAFHSETLPTAESAQ